MTPDTPSRAGTPRLAPADAGNLPRIPTTPISYGEARPLLEALSGPTAPDSFQGTYHLGPGATKARMDLDIA